MSNATIAFILRDIARIRERADIPVEAVMAAERAHASGVAQGRAEIDELRRLLDYAVNGVETCIHHDTPHDRCSPENSPWLARAKALLEQLEATRD